MKFFKFNIFTGVSQRSKLSCNKPNYLLNSLSIKIPKPMRISIILLFAISLCSVHSITAQKKKKLSKQEKRMKKFELQKQALIDSTFVFQTTEIVVPYFSQNRTGGYLHIEDNIVRIQEIDWPKGNNILARIRDQTDLYDYQIVKSIPSNVIVQFKAIIKGSIYNFSIVCSLEDGSKLTMSIEGGQKVIFKGKVKKI